MNTNELMTKASRTIHKFGFGLRKAAPEILVVAGVVGVVASTVMACKATTKAGAIVDDLKNDLHDIDLISAAAGLKELNPESTPEDQETVAILAETEQIKGYTEEDMKKDTAVTYAKTALNFIKLYGPAVAVGVVSITAIVASHGILRKRNLALAAAYATVDQTFKDYRKRLIDRFGKELDKELKYGIKTKTIEEKVINEDGTETTVEKTVPVIDSNTAFNGRSPYAKFFDNGNPNWTKDPEANLFFIMQQQNWANERLKAEGHLFLNDVYESLGMPKTRAGQAVGWLYNDKDVNSDNYVDFHVFDLYDEAKRQFVNGYERTILLDFNVTDIMSSRRFATI